MTRRPRVACFALRDLHWPVLRPVYRALVAGGGVDVGVIAPPFVPSGDGRVQEGLAPGTEAQLASEGGTRWTRATGERYDAVVVADACYDRVDGWGPAVCIGHGTISKGLYFTSRPVARRENFARVLCVPGPAYADMFGDAVFTRIAATGFSKLDALAEAAPDHRARHVAAAGLDPDRRTILFAPTYNPELTALDALAPLWPALDPRDQVVFKLHGATDAAWVARYRALAAELPRAHFAAGGDLAPWVLAADVVVSDVSSAAVEAIAANRPVIVYDSPSARDYPHLDRRAVEFAARAACYVVTGPDECRITLDALRMADPLAAKRAAWAARLFPPLDGRNAARIAAEVRAVAFGQTPHQFPVGFSLHAWVPASVDDDVRQARIDANLARAWSPVVVSRGAVPPQPFVCLTGETQLPEGWDLVWAMAARFNAPSDRALSGVFGPTLPDLPEYGAQRLSACFADAPPVPPEARQTLYKHHAYDQIAVADSLRLDGAIVANVPHDLASAWVTAPDATARAAVLKRVRQRGGVTGVLPGIHAVPPGPNVATPDVLFYALKNVHLPLFAPVIAEVRRLRPSATIAFAAPPHDPAAREGLTAEERARFAVETGAEWVNDAVHARPGVTVIADAIGDRLRGHARIVNLGHGLISKGQYYGANRRIGRENLAHELCVPGPWHAAQLRPHLYIPVHVTGMSKLDALFAPFDEAAARQALDLDAGERVLLWCPTFNPELSGLPVIGGEIRRLTAFGTVCVKPHGTTDPAAVAALRAAVAGDSRVRVFDPSADATPLMRIASLLVTDVSSVMFEFAALDRPIVLVDNPRQAEYVNYDPADVEYAMRDVGPRVGDAGALVEAVRAELADPGRHAEARRRVTAAMFAATDGRNAARIAAVLCAPSVVPPWRRGYDAVVPEHFSPEDLAYARPGLDGAARVLVPSALAGATVDLPAVVYRDAAERRALLGEGPAPNVVVFRRRARLVGDWQAPLFGPLYLDIDAPRMTAPLTTDATASSYVGRFLKRDRVTLPDRVTPDLLAGIIRITNPAERAPAPDLKTPVIAMRKSTLLDNTTGKAPVTVLDALVVS